MTRWLAASTALAATVVTFVALTHSPSAAAEPAAAAASTPTFVDDFTGPAGAAVDAAKWTTQTGYGYGGGSEKQAYTSGKKNAWLTGNGTLMIQARGETYNAWDSNYKTASYTSARLQSKAAVQYGTVSARIRLTGSKGAWPAFWTLGANYAKVGWPHCGELDVMETLNNYPNLYGSLHGPYSGQTDHGRAYNAGKMVSVPNSLAGGWHVYAATWSADAVTFLLDGQPYVTVRKAELPAGQAWALDNPQNILLNIAVGGMAGEPAAPSDFGATMEVDYVRVDPLSAAKPIAPPTPPTTPAPKPAKPAATESTRSAASAAPVVRVVAKRIVRSHGKQAVRLTVAASKAVRIQPVVRAGTKTYRLGHRLVTGGRHTLLIKNPGRAWTARKITLTLYRVSGGGTTVAARPAVLKR